MGAPLSLRLLRLATALAEPLAPMILRGRVKRGKEDPARLNERLGRPTLPRPPGPLVWLHGASVGESVSLLPLAERFRRERPNMTVLVTSGTVTSAELLARRLPAGAIHQYVPVDGPGAARRFLDHWRPDLAIFVESELWPNLLLGAKQRGARLALVSARMTEKSALGWGRYPGAAKALMDSFDLILPQDDHTATRLLRLGARIDGYANLKLVGDPLPFDGGALERLKAQAGDREIVVAASTHAHEEVMIASAVTGSGREPLLVIVPRHPDRGPDLADELRDRGYTVARRAAGEALDEDVDIYLADTLGELGLFFRLADVVVMGGSFEPSVGGHNPLEPARLGKPVLHGPHVDNWIEVHREMGDGAVVCANEAELSQALAALLSDPDARRVIGALAGEAAGRQAGMMDHLWERLAPLMAQ